MKGFFSCFFLIFFCGVFFGLVGCGSKEYKTFNGINYLKNIKSYSCSVRIFVKNNKEKYEVEAKQYYLNQYGSRLELNDSRVYIFKEDKVYVKDKENDKSYYTEKTFHGVLSLSLIEEYLTLLYTNERIKYNYKEINQQKYQITNIDIHENNRDIYRAELYFNMETKAPSHMYLYDEKGILKIEVVYSNFVPNEKINSDLFDYNNIK